MNQITPIRAADCVFQNSRKIGELFGAWKVSGNSFATEEPEADLQAIVGDFFDAGMSRSGISTGDRVYYVGGMSFAQTDQLNSAVGEDGEVVVGDINEEWSESTGASITRRAVQDRPNAEFDAVLSVFGTHSFEHPVSGLRGLCQALKSGGQMTQVVWRDAQANPWINTAIQIVRRHLTMDAGNAAVTDPFTMADRYLVEAQMGAAGFENINFERVDKQICIADDAVGAVEFLLNTQPVRDLMRGAGAYATVLMPHIRERLLAKLTPVETEDGVWMDASAWIVTAENPT